MWCACCVNEAPAEEVVTAVPAPPDAKEEETMELRAAFVQEPAKPLKTEESSMPEVEAKAETPEIKVVPAPPPPAPPAPPAPKQTDSALSVRQPAESYVVKVSKEGGKLGGGLDPSQEDCCVVRRVDLGGVLDKKGVRVYDRVLKVNGEAKKSAELVRRIKEANDLELYMERPKIKEVLMKKDGKKVGLRLNSDDECLGLIVKEVTGGVAADMPKGTFEPKDRIVEINGQSLKAADMLKRISEWDKISLTVCSYSL
ncbi:prfA [Symbiodinium necroappetens]|uniref:PrfA protein n=1 Tax=Symbiodinium necroappetens TaxID=1628268 RepID=A0A813AL01_9DINO|nr:prfA [Symbiodinium necroappetens]